MTARATVPGGSEEVRVSAVMHRNVAAVCPETSFQEIAQMLVSRRISAVPVVDAERHVLGVVSADDLLTTRPHSFRYSQRASRVAPGRAAGRTAGELMSAPALVIEPDTTVARAADVMQARHVKRLPVVDGDRRLLGIVARSDLLEVYLRGTYEQPADTPVLVPRRCHLP